MTVPAFAGAIAYAFFDTPLGRCAVAWGPRGIVALHLPETRESAARARVLRRFPEATEGVPTPDVRQVQAAVVALLRGETADLSAIPLDMTGVPDFHARVYAAARAIPPGGTLSYGEVAAKAGSPGAARAVGQALGRNPFAIIVPCHRVLAAGGKVGGFSAQGGPTTKIKLLSIEGAAASNTLALFDGDGAFGFDPVMAVEHLRAADPALARVMDAAGPFRMKIARAPSLFVALAEAIVYQQLSGKAAATIFARVRALFPRGHEGPTAAQILRASDEKLRGADPGRGQRARRRGAHRAAGPGARHRALDGRDAADVPARPAGRAAGRRSRRAQGLRLYLSQAHAADEGAARKRHAAMAALSLGRELVHVARRGARTEEGRGVSRPAADPHPSPGVARGRPLPFTGEGYVFPLPLAGEGGAGKARGG
jgi:methylated-DNA-[protein]-cysteine S-methyltransferase